MFKFLGLQNATFSVILIFKLMGFYIAATKIETRGARFDKMVDESLDNKETRNNFICSIRYQNVATTEMPLITKSQAIAGSP